MVTLNYANELELNQFLGMDADIPDRDTGSSSTRESVGRGDGATIKFFFDQKFLINNTENIFLSTNSGTTPDFSKGQHYSIDYDRGILFLNDAGTILLGTGTIDAEYQYNSANVKDTVINIALARSEAEIDNMTTSRFVDASGTTPAWTSVTREEYDGQGRFNRDYFTAYAPLADMSSNLTGTLNAAGTQVFANSTDGFPDSGIIVIDTEQITYDSKTGSSFEGLARGYGDSSAGTHSGTAGVYSTVVEVSLDEEGTDPTWDTMERNIDYDLDNESGRIHMYKEQWTTSSGSYFNNLQPLKGVPNRMRFSYLYGQSTIPEEIKRATLMLASRELRLQTVTRALIQGRDEFKPATIDVDLEWVKNTIKDYNARTTKRI